MGNQELRLEITYEKTDLGCHVMQFIDAGFRCCVGCSRPDEWSAIRRMKTYVIRSDTGTWTERLDSIKKQNEIEYILYRSK